jgi:hypothetical protein
MRWPPPGGSLMDALLVSAVALPAAVAAFRTRAEGAASAERRQ